MAFPIRVVVAFATVTFVATAAQGQTTWHVDDDNCPGPGTGTQADPFCMIQDGMDAAVNGDEVVVAPGTYNELIDFLGMAITVRSSDGADVTIIDGAGLNDSVVKCVSGEGADTVLDGFTITGGTGSACITPSLCGGGMYNANSAPTVLNCTFSGNTTGWGGGMYNDDGGTTVTNCTFSGNTASVGGGMFNDNSNPTVTNCTFSGNTAGRGGGMYNRDGSTPTVTNCTFSGNQATLGGGMSSNNSRPSVTNCTFSGNSAAQGGGMFNRDGSSPTVINCLFSGNIAIHAGAGMYNDSSSTPAVINCTFSRNRSNRGFGGGGMSSVSNASPRVINCIFWENTVAGEMGESAQIADEGDSATTVTYSLVQGLDTFANTGNIDADPLFVDADGLDDVPGTEDDNLRLLGGSPSIDAGDNTAVPIGVTTDLDGNRRFADDLATTDSGHGTPPIVDMGAYEFPSLCGNGVVDADEECDDGNIVSGDGCDNNCTFTACGNGIQTAGEECDGAGAPDCPTLCQNDCTCPPPACGNGVIEIGEECDDGNLDDGDLCSGQCLIEGACCDRSPGVGGTCTVTIQDACVGKQLVWSRGVLCSETLCEALSGATVSLKAVEVNGVPLPARTNTVTVAPGDTILAQIFISGWGDEIGKVRLWQSGVLGQAGSTSGISGSILPLGWPFTPDDGAFIESDLACTSGPNVGEPCVNSVNDCGAAGLCDCRNPDFIMCGFDQVICAVATNSLNYRYGCLFFDEVGTFDDGRDFYAGTLILDVSQDACGTFTFAMDTDPLENFLCPTNFIDKSDCIRPVTEGLVIEVECFTGTGACCDSGNGLPGAASCDRVALEDCQCETCSWFGDTACAELKATGHCLLNPIPTVSEWGLVILTLLLLTGAKIYFGRRRVVTA